MPKDHHGVTHAGSLGLFDDEDENAASTARAESHEIVRLERKMGRRERQQRRKASGKPEFPHGMAWLGKIKIFSGSSSSSSTSIDRIHGKYAEKQQDESEEKQFEVVRRPATPEPVYKAQDVDPVDTPWLRECGMVRVKSDDAGGCHIVPKSTISKSE